MDESQGTPHLQLVPGLASTASWRVPPKTLVLRRDEVHVWRANLNVTAAHERLLREALSQEELRRASRFHFQRDRERFVVARGVLRAILARYVAREPGQLRFCYGPYGKPVLNPECGVNALRFNSSHSHDLVLCAVTLERAIGVDVEHVRGGDAEDLARGFFSPQEIAALTALPPDNRQAAFFACWTRKEAYVKAKGDGFTMRPDRFSVSCSPGEPAALLDVEGQPEEATRWSLWALNPAPGYVAALAVEGGSRPLRFWDSGSGPC